METQIEPVVQVRDWCIDRIRVLSESDHKNDHLNAIAIAEEFHDWINISDNSDIDYICLEEEID